VARRSRAVPGGSSPLFFVNLAGPPHVGGPKPEIQTNISMEAFEIFELGVF
jgi:hypothetical protein